MDQRSTRKTTKCSELNDNENISCQNLWDAAKVFLGENILALMLILKREGIFKINSHLKKWGKQI